MRYYYLFVDLLSFLIWPDGTIHAAAAFAFYAIEEMSSMQAQMKIDSVDRLSCILDGVVFQKSERFRTSDKEIYRCYIFVLLMHHIIFSLSLFFYPQATEY